MSDDIERRARARVGSVLDEKWTLETLLGIGGMGAVYAARHRNAARAAIKVLHANLARHDEVRERFLREGYAANRVEHPGVVKVLDDDEIAEGPDAGTAYLVMELLEGESLEDRFERGPPVGELEFLAIAEAVLDVLEAAHAHGVVHRDLKPENLFLLKDDDKASAGALRVKVLDFGLARLLEAHVGTIHGVAVGTPSFMSPEQASGQRDAIDGRTDLFSLAATGFRLVTGRRIHDGASPLELVTKMSSLPAPPIQSIAPRVSAPFARVIDKALAFDRDDRYPDAKAMHADVKRAQRELVPAPAAEASLDALPTIISPPIFDEAATIIRESPPLPAKAPERTVELSASDFETVAATGVAVMAPAVTHEPPAPPSVPAVVSARAPVSAPAALSAPAPTPVSGPAVLSAPAPLSVPVLLPAPAPTSARAPMPAPAPEPVYPVAIREPASLRPEIAASARAQLAAPAPPPPRSGGTFLLVITALVLGAIGGKVALHALPPDDPEPASAMPAATPTLSDAMDLALQGEAGADDAEVLSSEMPPGAAAASGVTIDGAPDEPDAAEFGDGAAAIDPLAVTSDAATGTSSSARLDDASAADDASFDADAHADGGARPAHASAPGSSPTAVSTPLNRPRPAPKPEATHPVQRAPEPPRKRTTR